MSLRPCPRWTFPRHPTRWLLVAFALAAMPAAAPAQVLYAVTDLGTLGGASSEAFGINASGQVVGRSNLAGDPNAFRAFRSTPSGQALSLTDLGSLGGTFSFGWAINTSGQVTGQADLSATGIHVFRTTPAGRVSDPGADLGIGGAGYGINLSGQVAGTFAVPAPPLGVVRAFRTSPNGQPVTMTDLGVLPGGVHSEGRAINDAGQVAGFADTAPGPLPGDFGPTHAFRTTAAGLVSDPGADLGTLGGPQSRAFGINASGQVVGQSFIANGLDQHAFRSSPNGQPATLTDLGTLGGNNSGALAINSFGVVVGDSTIVPGSDTRRAFIYDTQMRDLNALIPPGSGWILGFAYGINDAGQIAGVGNFIGQTHAFRLNPVPEPGALCLAGAAAALALWGRRLLTARPSRSTRPRA
jgi:probable HAF family extracellular repeat protein